MFTIAQNLRKRSEASFTIEAAVIIPITMILMVSLVFMAFFLHDKVIFSSTLSGQIIKANSEGTTSSDMSLEIESFLTSKLIMSKNVSVSGSLDALSASAGFIELAPYTSYFSSLSLTAAFEISNLNARETILKYRLAKEGLKSILGGNGN